MKLLIFLLCIIFIGLGQDTITVICGKHGSVATILERKMMLELELVYNQKTKNKIHFAFNEYHDFAGLFTALDKYKGKENVLVMNSITITDDRKLKYDFSTPYIPVKTVIVGSSKKADYKEKKLAYIANTVHVKNAEVLAQLNKMKTIKAVNIKELLNFIRQGKVDYAVVDNVTVWNEEGIYIVEELFEGKLQGCGLLYPKGSPLRDKLDVTLKYLIKSKRFYAMCEESYGSVIADYFKNQLK